MKLDKTRRELLKTGFLLVFFLGVVFFVRSYIVSPYIVDMSSMFPTLKNAEIILVNRMAYITDGPLRGDIIVFDPPSTSGEYVKRVIGLPGEYVEYTGGKVWINGNLFVEEVDKAMTDYSQDMSKVKADSDKLALRLDRDEYFVIGDNRQSSLDSRSFGPIRLKVVIGRAFMTVWPIDRIQVLQ